MTCRPAGDHHFTRRSSSAWAKYAEAFRRISLVRFSSRTSRSRSFSRCSLVGRQSAAVPAVTLGLTHPLPQRLRCAAHLAGDGRDRRPLRGMLRAMLPHQTDRALADFRRISTRSCHGAILSRNWPSEKLGTIQMGARKVFAMRLHKLRASLRMADGSRPALTHGGVRACTQARRDSRSPDRHRVEARVYVQR